MKEIEKLLNFFSFKIEKEDENISEDLNNILNEINLNSNSNSILNVNEKKEIILILISNLLKMNSIKTTTTTMKLNQYLILFYDCFFLIFDEFYINLIEILYEQLKEIKNYSSSSFSSSFFSSSKFKEVNCTFGG